MKQSSSPVVFSITSGKGGVGKTNLSVNLAVKLAQRGKRVCILDADLGLANVDVILGLTPKYNLFHLFHEGVEITDVIHETPYGFSILPASSGISDMIALSTGQKLDLLEAMDALEERIDHLIVDTGAGINDNVIYFNLAAQERIVVMTTEPTSLTDAYALIKVLKLNHGAQHFKILVNMAPDERSAKEVFSRLSTACDRFLDGVSLDWLGFTPLDPLVRKAVTAQVPFTIGQKGCPADLALGKTADAILSWTPPAGLDGNIKFFWKKLLFNE